MSISTLKRGKGTVGSTLNDIELYLMHFTDVHGWPNNYILTHSKYLWHQNAKQINEISKKKIKINSVK